MKRVIVISDYPLYNLKKGQITIIEDRIFAKLLRYGVVKLQLNNGTQINGARNINEKEIKVKIETKKEKEQKKEEEHIKKEEE